MVQWEIGGKKQYTAVCCYCSKRACPILGGGFGLQTIGVNSTVNGASWLYNAGANATPGYWTFDKNDQYVIISINLPDLLRDNGIQEHFIIEVEMDAANATDRYDYALYDSDGTKLEEATNQPIGTAAKNWIQLGSGQGDHITSGDMFILFLGNFETNLGIDTTVNIYRIRITYQIAIESL